MCNSYKNSNSVRKKVTFGARNPRENGFFFECFPQICKKTLCKFDLMLQLHSNLPYSCPFGCKMCANNKKGKSIWKNVTFVAKKPRKTGFSGFPTKFQLSASQLSCSDPIEFKNNL